MTVPVAGQRLRAMVMPSRTGSITHTEPYGPLLGLYRAGIPRLPPGE
ncbi:hypothetical protein ACIBG4_27095 [Nonomuraea sp. NPDC050383]